MPEYYKLVGGSNPHTNWTTEVVLEKDEDGNPTVSATAAGSELTAEQRDKVEKLGYTLEKTTKDEVEEAQASGVGSDVAGTAPLFGNSEAPDQSVSKPKGNGVDQANK